MADVVKKVVPDYQTVDGFIICGAFSPQAFRETLTFKPRAGDLFVATYPKCGTTWTQQILYLIRHGGKPPVKGDEPFTNCPYLEFTGVDVVADVPPPRDMKIHLPFNLTPYSPDAKYIVVIRNPKDTVVSFFHHTRTIFYGYQDGDFNDFFDLFMKGQVDYGDYFDHHLSWYEHRNDPNVLYLYYEKMKADHRGAVLQIAHFLGPKYEEFVKDSKIVDDIVKYSSFSHMKKETNFGEDAFNGKIEEVDDLPLPRGFKYVLKYILNKHGSLKNDSNQFRKGIVGDWRNCFTSEQNSRMNEQIAERLKGTELLEYWNSIGCL